MAIRRDYKDGKITFGKGLTSFVSGEEALAQKIKATLLIFRTEWYLDYTVGIPWLTLNKKGSVGVDGVLTSVFSSQHQQYLDFNIRQAILGIDEVDSINYITYNEDRNIRQLYINLSVKTIYNTNTETTLTLGVGQ